MSRDTILAVVVIAASIAVVQSASSAQLVGNQTAGNAGNVAPQSSDPAAVVFATESGLMLHAVKPGSVADYEAAITALQAAFSKAEDERVRRIASGWRVFRVADSQAKGAVLFVHLLMPADTTVDYRPSLWLDELLAGAPPELLAKYRDSFAAPPTKLSLTAFADMAVAPVNASPARPSNGSPAAPGNTSNGSPSEPANRATSWFD